MSNLKSIENESAADFPLGIAVLKPISHEVQVGARVTSIEPRVMRLLVVLAKARGAVVSRNALVDQCWGGRAISEDALNRTVAKARLVANELAASSFQIETVVKVGYRLIESAPLTILDSSTRTTKLSKYRSLLLAAGLVVITLAAGVAVGRTWLSRKIPEQPMSATTSPIVAAAADLETRGLSLMFEGEPKRTAEGLIYLRQAASADPKRASVWGSLSMGYVLSLSQVSEADQPMTIARVREAAARARALDPREGRSAAALLSLMTTFRN
jgi:DNA-binding winged helix-turn-helix (wHTH) protein